MAASKQAGKKGDARPSGNICEGNQRGVTGDNADSGPISPASEFAEGGKRRIKWYNTE